MPDVWRRSGCHDRCSRWRPFLETRRARIKRRNVTTKECSFLTDTIFVSLRSACVDMLGNLDLFGTVMWAAASKKNTHTGFATSLPATSFAGHPRHCPRRGAGQTLESPE